MPRDSNGNYVLPAGNPVVSGTIIASGWANPTMSDIGVELTNSLDRQGRGGMLAPFKFLDGTAGAPGMTWTSEPSTGFFRAGASDQRATVAGVSRMRWTSTGVDVYDAVAGTWVALSNVDGVNFAVKNANNKFTQPQTIVNSSGAWGIWKDALPTLAGRFTFNVDVADGIGLGVFNGTDWLVKFSATVASSSYFNDGHTFFNTNGTVTRAKLDVGGLQVGNNAYQSSIGASRVIGITGEAGNAAAVGVFCNDGTNNPRAELYGAPNEIGINYTFSNNIAQFLFKRVGAAIFGYNENGMAVYDGLSATFFSASQARSGRIYNNGGFFNIESNGAAGLDVIQFMQAGTVYFSVADGAAINVYNAFPIRYYGPANAGLTSFREAGGSNGFRIDQESGQPVRFFIGGSEKFTVRSHGPFSPPGTSFLMSNPANTSVAGFYANGSGSLDTSIRMVESDGTGGGRNAGAVIYHNDVNLYYGGIFVSTSVAPGTGGTPGQIWMQVDA